MAERQPNQRLGSAIGAKIVLSAVAVAVVTAAIAITVVLLQDNDSGLAMAPSVPAAPTATSEISTKRVLDKSALEGDNGIKKILIETYGVPVDQIHRVDCPAGQEVDSGNTFTCTVQIGSNNVAAKLVDVKVIDNDGEYEVGPPRDK